MRVGFGRTQRHFVGGCSGSREVGKKTVKSRRAKIAKDGSNSRRKPQTPKGKLEQHSYTQLSGDGAANRGGLWGQVALGGLIPGIR